MGDLETKIPVTPDTSLEDGPQTALPPLDRGKDAWLVLAACCVLEALVWGKYSDLEKNIN